MPAAVLASTDRAVRQFGGRPGRRPYRPVACSRCGSSPERATAARQSAGEPRRFGLVAFYLNVVPAGVDIKIVRPEQPPHHMSSLAIAQIDESLPERTRHYIADALNAPLDV